MVKQSILSHKHSIIFEILELVVLFILSTYYLIHNYYLLSILYFVPFVEHIRQVIYQYRQQGGSSIDYLTLFYFVGLCIYSFKISVKLSLFVALIGCSIHIFTIIKNQPFLDEVSIADIKSVFVT